LRVPSGLRDREGRTRSARASDPGRDERDHATHRRARDAAPRRFRPGAERVMTRVAFLGLGHMGLPMAVNLVKAGHEVHGFDLVPAAIEAATAAGIPVAANGADAARDADVVITMFPAGKHVIAAYQDELLAAAKPGTLFIECSTIAVDEARTAHQLAVDAGHRNVDAPVSGGVVGAEAGTLAFMV